MKFTIRSHEGEASIISGWGNRFRWIVGILPGFNAYIHDLNPESINLSFLSSHSMRDACCNPHYFFRK